MNRRITLIKDHLPNLRKVIYYENGFLKNKKTHRAYGSLAKIGYLECTIKVGGSLRIRSYVHRFIYLLENGFLPHHVDHINKIKTDNRINNLRSASSSQNGHNCKLSKNNTSGENGIYYDSARDKWATSIKVNYKKVGFKRCNNREEAVNLMLC